MLRLISFQTRKVLEQTAQSSKSYNRWRRVHSLLSNDGDTFKKFRFDGDTFQAGTYQQHHNTRPKHVSEEETLTQTSTPIPRFCHSIALSKLHPPPPLRRQSLKTSS